MENKNMVFDRELVDSVRASLNIPDLTTASIAEVLSVAVTLERQTGIPFIRMDQGIPALPAPSLGVEAQKAALDAGVANKYPPLGGLPALKDATSRFLKSFLDVDLPARCCVPGAGSASLSFAAFAVSCHSMTGRNKVLFLDPGFPVQKAQLNILGLECLSLDMYDCRGEAIRERLSSILASGDVAAVLYSNPNNPAWIMFNDMELRIIAEVCSRYGVIVIEDMAYFGMDSRTDYSCPSKPPYPPTIARYTDDYIMLLSASKIFSYAGERVAVACIGEGLYDRYCPALAARYGDSGIFGATFASSILYTVLAGPSYSSQCAMAEMMDSASSGKYDFVADGRIYSERAAKMKRIFENNNFFVVYASDTDAPIGDGFFFSIGYPGMTGSALMLNLLYFGISSISLSTTGSRQEGIRACTSMLTDDKISLLAERLHLFNEYFSKNA